LIAIYLRFASRVDYIAPNGEVNMKGIHRFLFHGTVLLFEGVTEEIRVKYKTVEDHNRNTDLIHTRHDSPVGIVTGCILDAQGSH
jgi:hypothetical protein